jgi:hypothetical protein
VAQAIARRLTSMPELVAMAARQSGRKGAGRLRAVIEGHGPAFTRSEAEDRFLALVSRAGIPRPEVNAVVAGHEVDFYWPSERLAVEADGLAFHVSPRSFEHDRRRDAELDAAGIRVVRIRWRQLTSERESLLFRLGGSLAAGAATRGDGA